MALTFDLGFLPSNPSEVGEGAEFKVGTSNGSASRDGQTIRYRHTHIFKTEIKSRSTASAQ